MFIHLLVCTVHFVVQERFEMYFESFEVAVIGVHFAECSPQAMSTVQTVPIVFTVYFRGRNHAHIVYVYNTPQLLIHGKHGLSTVLCLVERLFSGHRVCV